MKYSCFVDVHVPREKCVELWFDESHLHQWQSGFQHKNWTQGAPNEAGSVSEILLYQGKNIIELEETILENNLPDSLTGEYVHKHMTNTQEVEFKSISSDTTRIQTNVHYSHLNGLFFKLMSWLAPSLFKKQSQKWLDQFKIVAESIS